MKIFAFVISLILFNALPVGAQLTSGIPEQPTNAQPPVAPTVIPVSGQLLTSTGEPRVGPVQIAIALYRAQHDPAPAWLEYQTVMLDATGRYAAFFGATQEQGLSLTLFADDGARWMGITPEGGVEGPRVMLMSTPYAAKSATADALDGRRVADFVLQSNLAETVRAAFRTDAVEGESTDDAALMSLMSGSSTPNALAKYVDSLGTLGEATSMFEVSGKVGIGTTSPDEKLRIVGGVLKLDNNAGIRWVNRGGSSFHDVSSTYFSASDDTMLFNVRSGESTYGFRFRLNDTTDALTIDKAGWVGLGTTQPDAKLRLAAGDLKFDNNRGFRWANKSGSNFHDVSSTYFSATDDTMLFNVRSTEASYGFRFRLNDTIEAMLIDKTGNVGIGTPTPSAKLHVAGDIQVDGNIAAKYQDVAEWVGSVSDLEPGTVVVIDPTFTNRVMASTRRYDARVAGAVSAQPGVVLGEAGAGKELVAQSGRVRIKVDAHYGAIKPGDLLVTSPTKGHAMRSRPVSIGGVLVHRPGTLVGKALEPLPRGKGEILVLLTLQ